MQAYAHTQAFYDRRAPEYAKIWAKADPHLRLFAKKFVSYLPPSPPGAIRVLDTGTGTARDVKMLLRRGYDAHGIDFSPETIKLAQLNNRQIAHRLSVGDLRNMSKWHGQFRGIWDCTTFHHIPRADTDNVMEQFRLVLSADHPGLLFLREKQGEGEKYLNTGEYPGEQGRFFKLYQKEELCALVERHGFRVLESGTRQDRRMINFVWLFAKLG